MPRRLTKLPGSQYVSTTAVSAIIVRVRSLLNEGTASFWSDTEFLQWTNDAIIDITAKTWCLGDSESITLANSTLGYTLVNDYITIVNILYLLSGAIVKSLIPGHPMMIGHVPDPGEPVYWYELDGKVNVFPIQATTTGMTLTVEEVPVPGAMATTAGVIPIPFWFEDSIILYVLARALYKDNETITAAETMNAYKESLAMYIQELLDKPAVRKNDVKDQ